MRWDFPTFRDVFLGDRLVLPWQMYTSASRRHALLQLIAVAIEENVPLVPLLKHWREDERGWQRRRLRLLVQLLEQGRSLPDAIEQLPGILDDDAVLAIRFDSQSGTRTAAVRELLAQQRDTLRSGRQRVRRPIVYFCAMAPIGFLLISFLQMKIVPMFSHILNEFGTSLPPALQLATALSSFFFGTLLPALAVLFVVLVLLYTTQRGRSIRRALFTRLFRSYHQWHVADVIQKLSIATRTGRPVPGALSTLARYHFDPVIRQELLFVRNEVEQGADVWQSLAAVGMLSADEVTLVNSAERIGNRPWVLDQVAGVKRRRTGRRMERWSELVLPAIVLLMAGIVLLQALTVIQPLVDIINTLA